MKNSNANYAPMVGAVGLGVSVVGIVYLIGSIVSLLFGLVALLVYATSADDRFLNTATGIVGCILQAIAIAVITMLIVRLCDMQIRHILLTLPITAVLFLLMERFCFMLHALNLPWSMLVFPEMFQVIGIEEEVTTQMFVEQHLYLMTAATLTAMSMVVVVFSWAVTHLKRRRQQTT